jgi:colanic acid/amylovoran biosynthesis glycosyltransferase
MAMSTSFRSSEPNQRLDDSDGSVPSVSSSNKAEHPSTDFRGLKFGVIASLKKGMEQFIYREASHMEGYGASITLLPTKQGTGLYAPRESWRVLYWTYPGLLLAQIKVLFSRPGKYCRGLLMAIRYRSLGDFFLAAFFSHPVENLDAIYATFGDRKLFVGYFCKRLTGKPLLCTVHAYELYDNPNENLFRVALAACDQVLTVSQYNRELLATKFNYPASQTALSTYSIDLNEYRPARKFVVLIVGYFVARKGHEVLFRAVKSLRNPDIEVWVVGGEGAESECVDVRGLASELGISDQVAFFGKQSGTALRALFHACDVFCLPCHFDASGVGEGFPNVIIEAMAVGKPVIASRHVGIPEILESNCVEEKDAVGVAKAIDQLYQSHELRHQQGKRNRELAEQHFAPSNVLKTLSLAKQLATGKTK